MFSLLIFVTIPIQRIRERDTRKRAKRNHVPNHRAKKMWRLPARLLVAATIGKANRGDNGDRRGGGARSKTNKNPILRERER